jgi:hypothetical protein
VLCDPLCGSGAIAIEAALMAADTAPGLIRYGSVTRVTSGQGVVTHQSIQDDSRGGAGAATPTEPARRGTRQDYTRSAPATASNLDHSDDGEGLKEPKLPSAAVPVPLRWLDIKDEAGQQWEAVLSAARSRDQRHTLRYAARGSSAQKKAISVSATTEVAVALQPSEDVATSKYSPSMIRILANDRHAGSIDLARQAAELAGVNHLIDFTCVDIDHYAPSGGVDAIVTNPPWEKRLEDGQQAWEKLAAFMRRVRRSSVSRVAAVAQDPSIGSTEFMGTGQINDKRSSDRAMTRAVDSAHMIPCTWVLSGNPDLEQVKGLDRPAQSIPLRVATVEARFNQYLP